MCSASSATRTGAYANANTPCRRGPRRLSPCNLGESGAAEFRNLSLKVSRLRPLKPEDAPLPPGFVGDPWSLEDAARETTPTRERICLNGLWGFRPVLSGETPETPPPPGDGWGWFKVPGMWPASAADFEQGAQIVWRSAWVEEREGDHRTFEQGWYRRRIRVPAAWAGRRIALEFTMLQTHARAWVDGQPCGELWYPGGSLDTSGGRLRPGAEHELVLLVTARPLTATRDAFMAPDRVIAEKATVRLRGIAGDLFLDASPSGARIEDLAIETSVRPNTLAFVVAVSGLDGRPVRLTADVTRPNGRTMTFRSDPLTAGPDGVTALTLPYLGGGLHFLILLPDEPDGLAALERRMTPDGLAGCANLPVRSIRLTLPKFRIDPPPLALSGTLKHLGMRRAFDDPPGSADFDRMAPRRGGDYLRIAEVFHKAVLELDEQGTEAAAATAVIMALASAPAVEEIPEVRVDRPFLFAVQHRASGACLFLGRLADPR